PPCASGPDSTGRAGPLIRRAGEFSAPRERERARHAPAAGRPGARRLPAVASRDPSRRREAGGAAGRASAGREPEEADRENERLALDVALQAADARKLRDDRAARLEERDVLRRRKPARVRENSGVLTRERNAGQGRRRRRVRGAAHEDEKAHERDRARARAHAAPPRARERRSTLPTQSFAL